MDVLAIFELVQKGLSVVSALVEAGQSAAPAIEVLKNLVTKGQNGTVTDDDLAEAEAILDRQIDEFNLP